MRHAQSAVLRGDWSSEMAEKLEFRSGGPASSKFTYIPLGARAGEQPTRWLSH